MPQLAPNAAGGRCNPSRKCTAASGARPIIVRPCVSKDMVVTTGRPVRAAASHRRLDLGRRRHGLDPQEVDAAVGQGLRLLGEDLGGEIGVERT